MNLVSLLPLKCKKKCQRVFVLLFGQNKTKLPICRSRVKQSISNKRTERKMPDNSKVFYVVQKRNRQARQTETSNY